MDLFSAFLAMGRYARSWGASQERDVGLARLVRSLEHLAVAVMLWLTACLILLLAVFAWIGPDVRGDLVDFVYAVRGQPSA
ncbi:hypothetical protein GCM10027059_50480 [Myceligenerans halotolerans]